MMLAAVMVACVAVSGRNITAGDLARAVPSFTPVDSAAIVAYAPLPGVRRVFHGAEIRQTLNRLSADAVAPEPFADVCFERQTALLAPDAVSEAMRRALGSGARIEIVEVSQFSAPPGELVFPLEDLGAPPVALWRGYVRYDGDKKFRVWARAKVTVESVRLIALEELRAGVPIKASQVSPQKTEGFPDKRTTPASSAQAEGCIPRRIIAANAPVWKDAIDPPNDVSKGDQVTIVVHSGRAQLSLGAEAETSGRRGDLVAFKNPESGKTFRARVEGPGKAGVVTSQVTP